MNDGGEVDLDLGNYERYLDVTLSRDNNITTGKIYSQVIEKEVRANFPYSQTRLERVFSRNSDVETTWERLSRQVTKLHALYVGA